MSEELPTVPPLVKRLAEEVHMTPIAWLVADDHISIVFQEGPKLRFSRGGDKPPSAISAPRSADDDRPGAEKSSPKPPPAAKTHVEVSRREILTTPVRHKKKK